MKKMVLMTLMMTVSLVYGLEFPGKNPGRAKGTCEYGVMELHNAVLAAEWRLDGSTLKLTKLENRLTGKKYSQNAPAYKLGFQNPQGEWMVVSPPQLEVIKPLKRSSSKGKLYSGKVVSVVFRNRTSGASVKWSAELRDGASYIRPVITISGSKDTRLANVSLNSGVALPELRQVGKGSGYPACGGGFFMGIEVPFFKNTIQNSAVTQHFDLKMNLNPGKSVTFGSVIGIYPENYLRRAFQFYVDRERARSYSQFLLYNCWLDLARNISEKSMLNRIDVINRELTEKRGVHIDAYVVDDGYDDYNRGFWSFNEKKFPNGFKVIARRLREINSGLGVWLSPSGGYQGRRERTARAKEIGINRLNLDTPEYYNWFLNKTMTWLREDSVCFLKWDRLGGGVSGHFMALMDIAQKLRAENPHIFLATTVGTWPSSFWLNYVDCTWRDGWDVDFAGVGDNRERWMTYRDGYSYKQLAKSEFLFPLTAMMNHGVVFANGLVAARNVMKGGRDLRKEVRSYFGGGYAMQELYLTPDLLGDAQWDAIAESAKWAKKNEAVLADAHFIGGDPLKLEVYGFAAWNRNRGTLVLRNPSGKEQIFSFDIGKLFELPPESKTIYSLLSPYKDQRVQKLMTKAGRPLKITLQPFEVLVFDGK